MFHLFSGKKQRDINPYNIPLLYGRINYLKLPYKFAVFYYVLLYKKLIEKVGTVFNEVLFCVLHRLDQVRTFFTM